MSETRGGMCDTTPPPLETRFWFRSSPVPHETACDSSGAAKEETFTSSSLGFFMA
jgi:hypothetical protein